MGTDGTDDQKGGSDGGWSTAAATEKVNAALREAGTKAAELAQNPIARSMLAAGLVAAAAALTQSSKVRKGVADASRDAIDNAEAAADSVGKAGAAIVSAATDAIRRVLAAGGIGDTEEASEAKAPKPAKKGGRGASSVKPASRKGSGKAGTKSSAAKSGAAKAAGASKAKNSSAKGTTAAKPAKSSDAKTGGAKSGATKKASTGKAKAATGAGNDSGGAGRGVS